VATAIPMVDKALARLVCILPNIFKQLKYLLKLTVINLTGGMDREGGLNIRVATDYGQ
jgi:hypothetical protein